MKVTVSLHAIMRSQLSQCCWCTQQSSITNLGKAGIACQAGQPSYPLYCRGLHNTAEAANNWAGVGSSCCLGCIFYSWRGRCQQAVHTNFFGSRLCKSCGVTMVEAFHLW